MSVLGVALLVALPGIGAVLAIDPKGEWSLPTRFALVAALGYMVAGGVSYLLALVHGLHAWLFLAVLVGTTVGLWIFGLRRTGPGERWRSLRDEVGRDPWLLVGLVVIAAIATLRFVDLPRFQDPSAFRYWFDGLELARTGHVPTLSVQYGALYPPAISKILLSAFSAGASFVVRGPLPGMDALLWLSAVGMAGALWSLGWELGLRATAPLLPILAMSNRVLLGHEMTSDLRAYRAESLGRMLAFAGAGMAIRAIRDGRRKDAAMAGLIFAAGVATHLVPTVVAGIALGWYVVGRLVANRTVSAVREAAAQGAIVAGVALLLAWTILALPPGDVGFEAVTSGGSRQAGVDFDPGLFLVFGRFDPPTPPTQAWYVPPGRVFEGYVGDAFGVSSPSQRQSISSMLRWSLPVAAVALALAMLLWFPEALKPIGMMAAGFGASLLAIALFFSHRYHTYVLGTFGFRRMFDYETLPYLLVGLAAVEVAVLLLSRLRPWAGPAFGAVVTVLLLVLVLPSGHLPRQGPLHRDAVLMLNWIRENAPCDARILANQRSGAVFKTMTGRVGVIEGMAPYLRPGMTEKVLPLVLGARAFFHHPAHERKFLEDQHVDYVVVVRAFLGLSRPIGRVNRAELDASPFLQLSFQTDGARVYRVVGLTGSSPRPDLTTAPGIECERGRFVALRSTGLSRSLEGGRWDSPAGGADQEASVPA